jgi:hypothetical protein
MRLGGMERTGPWIMAAALFLVGCGSVVPVEDASESPQWSEIETASGRPLVCLDELRVHVANDLLVDAEGWDTARAAAEAYREWELAAMPGAFEAAAEGSTSFVLVDDDGHRLARLDTVSTSGGWLVGGGEWCGTWTDEWLADSGEPPVVPSPDDTADGRTVDDEAVIIYGMENDLDPEEALRVLDFQTEASAAVGDLAEVFGDRFVLSSFVPGKAELKIYVTHSDPADEVWLASIDAESLGGLVTIEADPARQRPEGPCIDESLEVFGESGLLVLAAGVELEASLNFEEVGYCPGHEYEGRSGLSADGFLYSLEDDVLEVSAGSVVAVVGAGYPGATLDSNLAVIDDTIDHDFGHVWQLRVPAKTGRIQVDLRRVEARAGSLCVPCGRGGAVRRASSGTCVDSHRRC